MLLGAPELSGMPTGRAQMKARRLWEGQKSEKARKRELFFDEITRSAYHVNESLRTEVYIPYKSVIPGYYTPEVEELDNLRGEYFRKTHPNYNWSGYEHHEDWEVYLVADADHYPELVPVREAVIAWSRKNHLDADWCREIAVRTLDYWFREDRKTKDEDDEEQKLYHWYCPGGRKVNVHPLEYKLVPLPGFPRYFPFIHMSIDHYLQEVKQWARKDIIPQSFWHQLKGSWIGSDSTMGAKLDKYIEEDLERICEVAAFYARSLKGLYSDKGHGPVPAHPEEAKHIRWAVQAQVYKETTFSSIAESEGLLACDMPNTSYVRREVLKILEDIGLPPRKDLQNSGRRKGSKDKKPRKDVSNW
jgi:hypothetical protein